MRIIIFCVMGLLFSNLSFSSEAQKKNSEEKSKSTATLSANDDLFAAAKKLDIKGIQEARKTKKGILLSIGPVLKEDLK